MQKELILEKETDLQPGIFKLIKVDGRKLIVERIEDGRPAELELLHRLTADAVKACESLQANKRRMSEVLAGYKGGLFKSAQEVDDYLKAERETWDK